MSTPRSWLGHVPPLEARAALASLLLSLLLFFLKYFAYYLTGSAAIFSDAMESIVNVLASGVALYSLAVSHRPADVEHPYGHGKIEFLSAAFEGGMVLLAAVVIAFQAVVILLRNSLDLENLDAGILLMTFAMLANGALGLWLISLGRRRASPLLLADGKHLLADALTSVAALAALLIVHFTGWTRADPLIALLVAAYIVFIAFGVLRESAAGLMDRQDLGDELQIRQILDHHLAPSGAPPLICSYHKVRHRHSGRYHWVDFHIMVPAALDIRRGHEIASSIEWEIERALGLANATAHVEPCAAPSCSQCHPPPADPSPPAG